MTEHCDRCGVGEVALEPLEGSGRRFCPACVAVVAAYAERLAHLELSEILAHISDRFIRPPISD